MEKSVIRRAALPIVALVSTLVAAVVAHSHVTARIGFADVAGRVTATHARYLANAVVYVDGMGGSFAPPPHPVVLDERGLRFAPTVLPIVKGTTVRFVNHDATVHVIRSPEAFYQLSLLPGGSAEHVFAHRGVFLQLCRLHPQTAPAYVVVLPNPYFAVVRADGSFRIPDVPVGRYQLKAWQPHARGDAVTITVPSAAAGNVTLPLHRAPW